MTTRKILTLALLLLLAGLVGCSGMGRFDLDVTLDHQAFQAELSTIPSVEVNFVAVNRTEFAVWHNYSINKYWMPEDPQRVSAARQGQTGVVTFGEHPPFRQMISRTNPIWNVWRKKGSKHLIVMCNYPRTSEDKPGEADVRRIILPLEKQRWAGYFWGRRQIRFRVSPRGIDCQTPPLPPPPPPQRR
jgi:hypothetical protein